MSRVARMLVGGLMIIITTGALAASPMGDKPASPRSLPTDDLPPFGMLDDSGKLIPLPAMPAIQPGARPAGAGQPSATGNAMASKSALTISIAVEGARAAIQACSALHAQIAVAVVDVAGKPVAALMAEGSAGSVFVAMRKAAATLEFRSPSSEVSAILARDPALLTRFTPVMFLSGGALPIFRGQQLVGAIASSGAHGGAGPIGTQDEICARAGLQKINAMMAAEKG